MINDYQSKKKKKTEFIQPTFYGSQTPFARPTVKQIENATSHKPSEEFVKKKKKKYLKIR